ncbi:YciI family protein [Actinocrispum sp. NPDC049592]|uniref:YciI family protein n=1 Tax=Actinocrispum sp. NPDC049592 TaxID=3154835 RepID=UPI0034304BA5
MTRYLLSVHTRANVTVEPVPEERMRESHERLGRIERDMAEAGAWVFSGRLHDPDTATVVRMAGDEVLTTDGPFAESKDHLGGFYVIEAPDLDAALGWAGKVTACIGVPIEVRPFAGFADEPMV